MFKGLLSLITLTLLFFSLPVYSITQLNGAGASFPYPLYSKWFNEYQKKKKDLRFNYRPIGSGGGVRQVIAGTVDFGASDVPLKDKERQKIKDPVLEIPMVKGAVVVVYNLPGIKGLILDGETMANIFMGKIKKWNDPVLSKLNPKLNLPDSAIMVARRADSSGTTAIFTKYLASVSNTWKTKVGAGKALRWPTGFGGKGNDGVTGIVKENSGAIGYVELAYALTNDLNYANVLNQGKPMKPTVANITSSAYPISSKTYLLLTKNDQNTVKKEAVKNFIQWAFKNGDTSAKDLHYAPLSQAEKNEILKQLETF
jgi:phosphate transport system substrate-binding protein